VDYVVIEPHALSVHECPSGSKTASVGSGSGVGTVQSEITRCATRATMGSNYVEHRAVDVILEICHGVVALHRSVIRATRHRHTDSVTHCLVVYQSASHFNRLVFRPITSGGIVSNDGV
jgi:hypothetical protein